MPPDQDQRPWVEQEESPVPGIEIFNLHLPETAQSRALGSINHLLDRRSFANEDRFGTIMLNAAAMKDLLSANVDENASHFA